jgi:hypothetical protein
MSPFPSFSERGILTQEFALAKAFGVQKNLARMDFHLPFGKGRSRGIVQPPIRGIYSDPSLVQNTFFRNSPGAFDPPLPKGGSRGIFSALIEQNLPSPLFFKEGNRSNSQWK